MWSSPPGPVLLLALIPLGCGDGPGTNTDGGGGGNPNLSGHGLIELRAETKQVAPPRPTSSSSVVATFVIDPPPATGCTEKTFGACVLSTCPPTKPIPAKSLANAGALEVEGGKLAVVMKLASDGGYSPWLDGDALLFTGGETLTIGAPGGTVPKFSLDVEAPATGVTVKPPGTPGEQVLRLPRGSDATFTWSASGTGQMLIALTTTLGSTTHQLSCAFDLSSGAATVPAAALTALPGTSYGLDANVRTRATTRAGRWTITAHALTVAFRQQNRAFSYSVTLE